MAVGETINDGSVVWKKDFIMSLSKLPLAVGYNHKETFTSSGTFTAPITGLYKITLQGGGGGGCGSYVYRNIRFGGGGGGQGGYLECYEHLTKNTSHSFVVGAGGSGSAGSNDVASYGTTGGATSIYINGNSYVCEGGEFGVNQNAQSRGGEGGAATINNTIINRGCCGHNGTALVGAWAVGGGGGEGADSGIGYGAIRGGGGQGGSYMSNGVAENGGTGGDGYITFEWFDPADVWPDLFPAQN